MRATTQLSKTADTMYPTSRPFQPPPVEAAPKPAHGAMQVERPREAPPPKPTMRLSNGAVQVERPRETIPPQNTGVSAVQTDTQQTDMLRWLLRLTLGLLVVLVLAGAAGFWMMSNAIRDGRTTAAASAELVMPPTGTLSNEPAPAQGPPVLHQPAAAMPVVPQAMSAEDARKPKPAVPQRGQAMPSTAAPTANLDAAERERFLQCIGSLTGAQLYQSYLNIGFLADGVNAQIYQKADALKLLEAVNTALANMDKQMASVAQANITAEDKKQLARIQQSIALLQTQARELHAVCQKLENAPPKPEQLTSYQKARQEAWRSLADLLSLE